MNRVVLAVVVVMVIGGAGWLYYKAGQPTESERGLMEACLNAEDIVRLNQMRPSRLVLTRPPDDNAMCEQHRQKLGRRKVKAITDKYRADIAYQMDYGTPPIASDLSGPQGPAQAAR